MHAGILPCSLRTGALKPERTLTMFHGILFAVLTGISWIWIGVVVSYASRHRLSLPVLQLFQTLIGITVSLLLLSGAALVQTSGPELSAQTRAITAICLFGNGFLNYFMFLAMGAAMKRGPNGIIWSMVQSGLLFPFLMGILFFHVAPTGPRIGGIALITASLLLFGIGKQKRKPEESETHRQEKSWFLYALLAMVLCGINQCCGNLPSYLSGGEQIGSVERTFFAQTGTLGAWLTGSLASGTFRGMKSAAGGEVRKLLLLALSLNAVGLTASYLLFYRALDFLAKADAGSLGYPLVVSSCIAGFFLYSALILHEKSSGTQRAGFLLAIGGIVLLCR